jgi:hypothetical protein
VSAIMSSRSPGARPSVNLSSDQEAGSHLRPHAGLSSLATSTVYKPSWRPRPTHGCRCRRDPRPAPPPALKPAPPRRSARRCSVASERAWSPYRSTALGAQRPGPGAPIAQTYRHGASPRSACLEDRANVD